ncbi:MAG TPA: DUF5719 family protein [Acidimicrobiales bacterium]
MNSLRRIPLVLILAAVLIATGALSSFAKRSNPSTLPGGLALTSSAESTALYCSGLSSASAGSPGRVTFTNTTSAAHLININVVSDRGTTLARATNLAPYTSISIDPSAGQRGNYFGVGAQVSGGGVVAVEATSDNASETPCISTGVTNWYAAGFDTTVGSHAELSIYNPTATPAVFNVDAYTSTGEVAPAKYQGIAVGAHGQADIDLGTQVVDTTNVGVHVKVLRGALDIVGVQKSGSVVSLVSGVTSDETHAQFPSVTTAQNATAQVRLFNPGSRPANVSFAIDLAPYKVPAQSVTVAPNSSALATITPNSAIPAAGYAVVTMRSNQSVVASLATGTGTTFALSSPESPQSEFLVSDFTGRGFDSATATNTSATSVSLTFTTLSATSAPVRHPSVRLAGNATVSLRTMEPTLRTLQHITVLVMSSRPTLLVTLTLPTRPAGTSVVEPLDGR